MWTIQTIVLFFIGISLWSLGGILMKMWAKDLPIFSLSFSYFYAMFTNIYILLSYFLYFIPALIWTYLLTKYPISFVQPILALTYVITPIFAIIFIWESVPIMRWLWIVIIIFWVFLVSQS